MVEQLLSMHEASGSITLKNHSLKSPPGSAKMAQQVKALATKPGNEFDPQNSHCRMREPTPAICLLSSTRLLQHNTSICIQIHAHKINK